jgi:hypothetical protein
MRGKMGTKCQIAKVNWYTDCGHPEKSAIKKKKFLEVRDSRKVKELNEAI